MQILTDFQGANLRILSREGNLFHIAPDLRDGDDWFYWAFHLSGEPGETFSCDFGEDKIGYYGPAVSRDGQSWHWLGGEFSERGFSYTLGDGEHDVWFAHHILYPVARFPAFCRAHALTPERLTVSERGRDVPFLRIGEGTRAVLITARHHACESTGSYVFEGFLSEWLRAPIPDILLLAVPFVDYDGVSDGDQGKGRHPFDHNRDYDPQTLSRYAAVRAIRALAEEERILYALDFHSPWHKGGENDKVLLPFKSLDNLPRIMQFSRLAEAMCVGTDCLPHFAKDDILPNEKWNRAGAPTCGYYMHASAGAEISSAVETPYFRASGVPFTPERAVNTGIAFAHALRAYHETLKA